MATTADGRGPCGTVMRSWRRVRQRRGRAVAQRGWAVARQAAVRLGGAARLGAGEAASGRGFGVASQERVWNKQQHSTRPGNNTLPTTSPIAYWIRPSRLHLERFCDFRKLAPLQDQDPQLPKTSQAPVPRFVHHCRCYLRCRRRCPAKSPAVPLFPKHPTHEEEEVRQIFISENSNQTMVSNSEQLLHGPVAKRRKVARNSLCNLPTDILLTILSLLPINDAVRTSVLSRKLKHVWCSHTNLNFDKGTMRKGYFRPSKGYHSALKVKEFVERVDTVLHQHSRMGVEHMKIKFPLHSKHADHIDSWVSFAIASKTKKFVMSLSAGSRGLFFDRRGRIMRKLGEEPYSFPSQFFSPNNCSHLRCLELWSVSLQLPSDFKGLLNLRSLALVDVNITDEDVQCMLSKCNLLEFLEIAYCRMVTSIRMLHPLDRLMHLVVDICPKLQEIELNCSPTTLQYSGTMVPLIFASTSRLTNINVVFLTCQSALSYMVTGFPRTSPGLETLTLYCYEIERAIVPEGPFKFSCLRNLRLDLILYDKETRNVDVLDYAYLLKIAPFMETLELRMRMQCQHLPYCKEDGELRIGLPHQHAHLKYVRIRLFSLGPCKRPCKTLFRTVAQSGVWGHE